MGDSMRVPTLVLRKFKLNSTSNGEPCLEIVGRPSGVVAWLLTVMRLDTETRLTVTDLCVSIKSASLSGEFNNFIPLPHVSSTHCGFSKPVAYIILAAAIAIFGVFTGMNQRDGTPLIVGALVVAIVFLIAYFLSKKITIEIVTDGGLPLKMTFKPSVIEGVQVNIAYTMQALSLLNEKVLQAA
jgi:hypothetical protein